MTAAPPLPKPSAHGPRITWPMVLGWLTVASLLAPLVAPYLTGEKKLDAAGICAVLAALVGALNHSPLSTPGGGIPRPPAGVVGALLLVLALFAASCGGASAATRTAYGVEAARCVANERAIVDRQGTTEAQDRADLRAERTRCDAALAAIENGGQ